MRIVHAIDYFQPQLGYQETFLPKEQLKLGHDVCVVTSDRYARILYAGDAVRSILGPRIKGAGFFEEEGIPTQRLSVLFELPHIIWLKDLERTILECNPDMVHVHGVNILATRLAMLKKKHPSFKLVVDDHMTFDASSTLLDIFNAAFKVSCARTISEAADALVGVSQVSKLFMNERYGFPIEDIEVIPLGADQDLFKFNASARNAIRQALSIRESETVFVYAGKLTPTKGPMILVQAALNLMKKSDDIKILLIGNGPKDYEQAIQQTVDTSDRSEQFIRLDAVANNQLPDYYSAADVAVWPKQASLSMMEAMSVGLPLIISDRSEVTQRVAFNNGLTYQDGNSADLSSQMEILLDPKLRVEMGRNGKKLVEEQLNWGSIAQRFIQLVAGTPHVK
jgi:glycosyltransferase involved in cell wall biosynthesis